MLLAYSSLKMFLKQVYSFIQLIIGLYLNLLTLQSSINFRAAIYQALILKNPFNAKYVSSHVFHYTRFTIHYTHRRNIKGII